MSELQLGKYEFHPNLTKDIQDGGAGSIIDPVLLDESLIRLKSIGFTKVGRWKIAGQNDLDFILYGLEDAPRNILYAFVANAQLKYIGKTVKALKKRTTGYRKYGPSQVTNRKNHGYICDCLKKDQVVDIYFLPDNGLMNYGGFHINLAARLEDDLIKQPNPPWNGGQKETENETLKPTIPATDGDSE